MQSIVLFPTTHSISDKEVTVKWALIKTSEPCGLHSIFVMFVKPVEGTADCFRLDFYSSVELVKLEITYLLFLIQAVYLYFAYVNYRKWVVL